MVHAFLGTGSAGESGNLNDITRERASGMSIIGGVLFPF
jgi:hypothetical protein